MDRLERIQRLNRELQARRHPVSLAVLAELLDCTERNVKNIINWLRAAGAPIEADREHGGYYLDRSQSNLAELPGLWFNASELHALLASHQLLANVQPGWLEDYIQPLKARIEGLLDDAARDFKEVERRVHILQMAARPVDLGHFQKISEALIARRRLYVVYHGRERDKTGDRVISPQRLVYYRHNWYLDAWCHQRDGLRTFSLDRLHPARLLEETALDIDDDTLDAHFTTAYGIFAGQPTGTAHLRFTPEAAKWVADEHWHPRQQGRTLPDGSYELTFPYGDSRELLMDILKYGPEVEVVGPASLREEILRRVREMAKIYAVSAS